MSNKIIIIKALKFYAGYAFTLGFMLQSSWVLLLAVLAIVGAVALRRG